MKRKLYKPEAPMKCHCGKSALYRVYKSGFCKEHYADGVKATAENANRQKAFAIAAGFKKP